MIYLIFVQLFGIMLMSIVMEEIFLYNKLETVEEIVKKKVQEVGHIQVEIE